MVQGDAKGAIGAYLSNVEKSGHNLDVLQELGMQLIEKSARSEELEEQLIGLYGIGMSGFDRAQQILVDGISSSYPEVVLASIQLLSGMGEDFVDEVLCRAMHSPYLPVRIEALMHLSRRKSRYALPHVESLRGHFPPEYYVFFPDFYGMIGTPEAMRVFRELFEERVIPVRVATILSAAKFGRDDFLPGIRRAMTHPNPAEQEAAAMASGVLHDLKSVAQLEKLMKSPYENVQLSAAIALKQLGRSHVDTLITQKALEGNPFAILCLANIEGCEKQLHKLLQQGDFQIKLNATVALLHKRDPICLDFLMSLLLDEPNDWGFHPITTPGSSLHAWKGVPSAARLPKYQGSNIEGISLAFRENLLVESIELPQKEFLKICDAILKSNNTDLIPQLVRLLENCESDEVVAMLETAAQKPGSPLIRGYASLTLYRLNKSKEVFLEWMKKQKNHQLIQFRPMVDRSPDMSDFSPFDLTPEAHSRLLIECYEAVAEKREERSIEMLLEAIAEGNPKNRAALAGLLLRTIQ